MDGSINGRSRSSISTISTFTPKDRNIRAISTPITPPPIISRLEGRVEEHVRRLMAEFLISDAEEFARRAARIEELYREGRIGEGLYRKVMSLMSLLRSGGSAAGESSS